MAQETSTPEQAHPLFAVSTLDRADGTRVISVAGELDLTTVPGLNSALSEHMPASAAGLVIDLSEITFIDSTSLRVLVDLGRGMQRPLPIVASNENVLRIFKIAGLETSFMIVPTLEEALTHGGRG